MARGPVFTPDSIHPLLGFDPNLPDDDLAILNDLVEDAKVVGLGEPTHGQKEINQLRDRITRYLVKHEGFRVVAVEDSAIKCRLVNEFILHGHGTAEPVLGQQNFWTWRTKEFLALIHWLREWNVAHTGDQVRFIGIDFQDLSTPANELRRILREARNGQFDAALSGIGGIQIWGHTHFDERQWHIHLDTLDKIQGELQAMESISAEESELGLDCLRSLEQALRLWREVALSPDEITPVRWNRRDEAMAARVLAATDNDNRMVLYAQNGHIQTEPMHWMPEGAVTMGQVLKEHLASEYVVVSGVFGSGSYRGFDLQIGRLNTSNVGDPPAGTIDHELWSTIEASAAIVSLNSSRSVLLEKQTTRWAGAAIEQAEDMITPIRPAVGANAIAFVREATASESIS